MWVSLARGALSLVFRGGAGTAARGATVAAERGVASRLFGFAARNPIKTALATDLAATGGQGISYLAGQAKDAFVDNIIPNIIPENGGDWLQLGAGLLAGMNAFQGNYVSFVMLGVAAYYLDDILRIADNFLESKGVDIIPDAWHSPVMAGPAPA